MRETTGLCGGLADFETPSNMKTDVCCDRIYIVYDDLIKIMQLNLTKDIKLLTCFTGGPGQWKRYAAYKTVQSWQQGIDDEVDMGNWLCRMLC